MSKFEKPVNVKLVINRPKTIRDLSWRGRLNWMAFEKVWKDMLSDELAKTAIWLDESQQTALLEEYLKMTYVNLIEFHKKVKNGEFKEVED